MHEALTSNTAVRPSTRFKIGVWVATVFLFLVARSMPYTMAQFNDVFSNFGADLPLITRFFLHADFLWWILLLLVLAIAIGISIINQFQLETYDLLQLAFTILAILSVGLIIACIGAMYFPIFKLGSVV